MNRTGIGQLVGLPKQIVVAMLGVALIVTAVVDADASARQSGDAPTAKFLATTGHVPRSTVPSTPSTTVAPTTTTTAAPVAPAPTTTAPRVVASKLVSNTAPAPVKPKPAAPAPPHTAQSIPFGVYVGAGDPGGVASFAAATGTHPVYAADYLPGNEGWGGISNDTTVSWVTSQWRGHGYTLILGVPIIPTDANGTPQGTLAAGAAGQYNASFVTLANTLVSGGAPNAVLRLGWEFNGNWFPWQVTDPTDAANFAAYFRNIVTSMRSVPGQAFKFVWNPGAGDTFNGAYTPAQAYPGSAYVDYVGVDIYDDSWATPQTPQNAWANQLSQSWGLQWLAGFSASVGRPMVFPEWGVDIRSDGHGMGDDPYFIDQFSSWMAHNNVAWTSYFNYDGSDGSCDLLDGQFSASLAAFRADFG